MEVLCFLPSTHCPLYDFDLRATHARTPLPAALASVSFGFVLVRVSSSMSEEVGRTTKKKYGILCWGQFSRDKFRCPRDARLLSNVFAAET